MKNVTAEIIRECPVDDFGWTTLPDGAKVDVGENVIIRGDVSIGTGTRIGDGAEEEDIRHDLRFRADWIEADGFARYEVLRRPWYSDDGREWLDDDGEPVSDGMLELGSIELHGGPADGETVG